MGAKVRPDGVQAAPATNWTQISVALLVLVFGVLVYVLDRPSESAPFFRAIRFSDSVPGVFGPVGKSLPTFTHAFAFSLLTAAWLGGTARHGLYASVSWLVIDCLFELGQHSNLAPLVAEHIPEQFESLPLLQHAGAYFVWGTFDPWDLVSIALGAMAAYLIVRYTEPMATRSG